MALEVIDLVITIIWSAMFIVAAIVCFIGLRIVVSFCAPGLASGIGWRNIAYARILSLVFGAFYLVYGVFFAVLRAWTPDDERGWVGVAGYLLVVMHLGALRMIIDEYEKPTTPPRPLAGNMRQ